MWTSQFTKRCPEDSSEGFDGEAGPFLRLFLTIKLGNPSHIVDH